MPADLGEVLAGDLDQRRVEVDGVDSVVAEAMGEQGGVVAGSGADLQHPAPGFNGEPVQHHRHDRRLAGRRAGNLPPPAGRVCVASDSSA